MSDVESAAQAAYPDPGKRDFPETEEEYELRQIERAAFRAGWVARDVEVAELRAMLAAQETEWDYGVQWGDGGGVRGGLTLEVAQSKASAEFGDVIVRRTRGRHIEAGPWVPADTPNEGGK